MNEIFEALAAPFDPERISWRVGSTNKGKTQGMALAYLDSRDVQDRLNQVCGHNWQCEHIVSNQGNKVTCRIGVKFGDEWIWRSNGAGETDFEAEKGSYSDSFKRAAVMFNVGRYLYDIEAPWVELGDNGRIKAHEYPRLKAILKGEKVITSMAHVGEASASPVKFYLRFADEAVDLVGCAGPDEYLLKLANAIKEDGNNYTPNVQSLDVIERHFGSQKAKTQNMTYYQWCQKIRKFGAANVSEDK